MSVDPKKLGSAATFEGKDVEAIAVEVTNIAGGLTRAMPIDPVVVTQGEKRYLVAEIESTKIRHEPIDGEEPGGAQKRVQIFRAEKVAIVEGELVDSIAEFLDAQAAKIDAHEAEIDAQKAIEKQRAKDEASGQMRIDDEVGTEKIPDFLDNAVDSIDEKPVDEVAEKRAAKKAAPKKATGASKQVTPRPKKATGAKKTPAKKTPTH